MKTSNMNDFGFVFVPKKCNSGQGCNIHVHIHGCDSGRSSDKLNWVVESTSDYLKYAIANDLIILYPQVRRCWDVYGYTNDKYSGKYGI